MKKNLIFCKYYGTHWPQKTFSQIQNSWRHRDITCMECGEKIFGKNEKSEIFEYISGIKITKKIIKEYYLNQKMQQSE